MTISKHKTHSSGILLALAFMATLFVSCDGGNKAELKSFIFTADANPQLVRDAVGTVNNDTNSVQVNVPLGTDMTTLVATYAAKNVTDPVVKVDDEVQINGVTPNDFTNSVTYVAESNGVSMTFSVAVYATSVWQGDHTVSSQADLDLLKGFTGLTGDLFIMETQFTNLDGFTGLTSIGESLLILRNESLMDTDGLRNLTYIGRTLSIRGNTKLENLNGLRNLETVGSITIGDSYALNNVDALSRITTLPSNLSILETGLSNLDAFSNLTDVGATLSLLNNNALENLNGLDNLTRVGGSFTIVNNPILPNVQALDLRDRIIIEGDEISIHGNLD